MITGYCVKCKEKNVPMKDPMIAMTSRGGFMAKGICTKCGTKMSAMMSKDNAEKAISSGDAKKGY